MSTLQIAPEKILNDPKFKELGEEAQLEVVNAIKAIQWLAVNLSAATQTVLEYNRLLAASQQSSAIGGAANQMRWLIIESRKYGRQAND